jgi:hypothetical protein
MAKKGGFINYSQQVLAFTIFVVLVLTGAIVLSLDHAQLIDIDSCGDQENYTATMAFLRFQVVNGTDMNSITPAISGYTVQFTCNAQNISTVRWDFGDGNGADGISAVNIYELPGDYLIEAAITLRNGDKVLDYYYLHLDNTVLYEVNAPIVGHIWTFYTVTLLISGTMSLVWFVITFYNRKRNGTHIWPRAFTPELRLFLGFGLIFCYFLAIGFFNGIIQGALAAVGL